MLGGGILKLSLAASALIFSQGLIADEPQPTNQNTPIVKQNEANSQGINSSPSNPTGIQDSNQDGGKQPELDNQGGEKQPAEDNKDSEKQPELDNKDSEKQPAEDNKDSGKQPELDNKDSEKQPAEDNKDSGKQPELDNQGGEKQPELDNKDSEKQPAEDNKDSGKQPELDNKDSEKQPAEDNKDSGKQPELDNQGGEKQPAEDNKDSGKQPELDNQDDNQDPSVDTKDPDEPKKEGQVDKNQKDEASKEDGLKAEDTPKVDEAPKAEDKKEEVKEPESSKEDTNKEDASKGEEDSKKDEATKPTKPDVSIPAVPEKSPEEVKKEQLIKQTEEIVKNLGNLGNMAKDKVNELVTILVDSGVSDLATFDANKLDATTKAKVQTAANAVAAKVIDNEKSNITSNALGAFNVQINNMNKRLGEIRGLNSDIGTWFRAYGGRFSDSSNHINFYSTQFGADKMSNLSDADVITGAMIGFDKVNADTKAKGFNIGVYGSYIHNNGLFVDSVLKYANTSFKKTGVEFKKQNSVLLSVEGGYRAKINEKAYVEPSLEIITGRVGKYEAKSKANTISVKSFTPIMIKPQVYTGIEHKDFVFRAGVGAVVNAKKQEADIVINNIVNGIDAKAKTKLNSNNHGFASVGGSYKVNDNLRINLGVEKSFGSKFKKDYEVNAVIRYTF